MQETSSRLKVYAMPAGFSGCAFWRYRKPMAYISKQADRRVDFTIAEMNERQLNVADAERFVRDSDIISMQSPGHMDVLRLIRLYQSEGKKVVIDYDDFSFDLDPGNPRYADLGLAEKEVIGPDGKTKLAWRDGENRFDLASNISKYQGFKGCVAEADLVTTTTDYLAEKFRPIAKKVTVVPNAIDLEYWQPLPKKNDGRIRIGWFGGDSHYADLKSCIPLFKAICDKYSHARISFLCPRPPLWHEIFDAIPKDRLEFHDWAQLDYYPLILAARHIDIGICPLDSQEFNRCKSDIKWQEFTAVGAAVVAQNMLPYSASIRHKETGLLATTDKEWLDAVSYLIENKDAREGFQNAAYDDIRKNRCIAAKWRTYENAYLDLAPLVK